MFYTGKGDVGTTQLYGDKNRYLKSEPIFEALGTCDELNAYLGIVRSCVGSSPAYCLQVGEVNKNLSDIVHEVQEMLFILQAEIAGAKKSVSETHVKKTEKIIDVIEATVPELKHFVIPGSSCVSAHLEYARTLARTLERRVVLLQEEKLRTISPNTATYINRLSSLLFALARFTEYKDGASREAPSYR